MVNRSTLAIIVGMVSLTPLLTGGFLHVALYTLMSVGGVWAIWKTPSEINTN